MRVSAVLAVVSLAAPALVAGSSSSPAYSSSPATSTSDLASVVPLSHLRKRLQLCLPLLGCIGTPDYSSDVKNCGSYRNQCGTTWTNGYGAQCVAGVCMPFKCNAGYTLNTRAGTCVNTASDASNCGLVDNVCSALNGKSECKSGVCTFTSCAAGFLLTPVVGGLLGSYSKCVAIDTATDAKNCGSVGTPCPTALGSAVCVSGFCQYSACTTGYKLAASGQCVPIDTSTDVLNCGKLGNACPSTYANGGAATCVNGACTTTCKSGHAFDSTYNFCRDVSSDLINCGIIGNKCAVAGAVTQVCSSGVCLATSCASPMTLVANACKLFDFASDINNCGSVGNACRFSPAGATGICAAGQCVTTTCPTGFIFNNGACVLSASGKVRTKRHRIVAKPDVAAERTTLCPTGETACPILGSTSFERAVKHLAADEPPAMMRGNGGYECVDTAAALDSCGGCVSTKEGRDCTKIRGASGVGCSAGSCVVFSCRAGYRPSLSGKHCVRMRSTQSRANTAGNSTRSAGRHRHASVRQHTGGGAFH